MPSDGVSLAVSASLDNDTLKDLLKTTLENYPWDGKFATLLKYHDYPICNMWFRDGNITLDGGTAIVRNVQLTENGSARFTQPYETASPAQADVQGRLRANWVYVAGDFSISREEMLINRSKPEKLIDLAKTKRLAAIMDIANLLEAWAWKAPSSSTDELHPMGIPYCLVPITGAQVTAGTATHQGTYLSGFSDCYGIDPAQTTPDASRWLSYNDVWTNSAGDIADGDVTKIGRMLRRLGFRTPQVANVPDEGPDKLRLYATETIIESLEDRARKNNDSLAADVAKYSWIKSGNSGPLLAGRPVEWAEYLDGDTDYYTKPLVAVNHSFFQPFVMSGNWFRETGPLNDRTQHNVFTTFEDLQFNFVCTNRQRAGGVISYVAAA